MHPGDKLFGSTPRNTLLCLLLALLLVTGGKAHAEQDSPVAAQPIPLIEAIEQLRSAGIELIYSSDLVNPQLHLSLEEISLSALRKALPKIGLQLKPMGTFWVITTAEAVVARGYGRVITPQGNPVANARIKALHSGQQWRSDANGFFEITGISNSDTLAVNAKGYRTLLFPLNVSAIDDSEKTAAVQATDLGSITLTPIDWIENIIVTGSRYRLPYSASTPYNLSRDEIQVIPALGSDALRVATRLPGVSSVGVSAKPRIRGGLQDELLVLLDGVELLEPFHLADFQSGYSSIDSRTLASVDIYTGGFPSRYGNRMSGVMEITTDRTVPEFPTEIGLSVFSAFINNRGEAGKAVPMDWLLSLRGGNLRELTEFMEPRASSPKYSDGTAKLHLALSEQSELALGSIVARDDIQFTDDEESASSDIESYYLWLRLDTDLSDSLQSSLVLSHAGSDREKMALTAEEDGKNGFFDFSQRVSHTAVRNNYRLTAREHLLEFGLQLAYGRAHYDDSAAFDRGVLADLLASRRFTSRDIHRRPKGWSGGIYAAADLAITPEFRLQPNARWDFQDYYFTRSKQQFSPRLGLLYQLTPAIRFRFSAGRFYQPEGIHELQVIDGVAQFFKPQKSDQAIAGLDWQQGDVRFKGEVYYKRYRNPKPRFENLFNPFVLLPEIEPDRIQLRPQKAFARGLDLELKYDFSESLSGLLRFSYMDAQDHINHQWIPRRWSQRDTWNALLIWQRNSFSLSAALTWHSGWRSSRLPNAIPVDTQVPLETALNNTELRNHLSLDISAHKSWALGNTLITLYADITNVTERDNIAGLDFEAEEEDDQVLFTPEGETLLPLVASVGIIFAF